VPGLVPSPQAILPTAPHRPDLRLLRRSRERARRSVAFPAFLMGHDPTRRVIAISYGADLAIKHANDFRAVVTSSWYQRMFPEMRISPTKNTESEIITTRRGYRLATSIDGTLTGRGGDVMIIDDPLKPIDALSDIKREHVNNWYNNTAESRLDDKVKGAVVVVTQRLHMNDLVGMLGASDAWRLMSLAAIAEQEEKIQIGADEYHIRGFGDLLHAEREPRTVLDSLRSQIGPETFAAQYQQAPIPLGGAMIKREWVRRYDQLPAPSSPHVIQSWDTAMKEGGQNDFSVCTTWRHHQKERYLIHVLRGRFDYPTLRARAIEYARTHGANKILIEDAGVGTPLVAELKHAGLPAIGIVPDRDKVTRMSIQSGKFESGQVLFPNQAPWLADLEAELFAFPNGPHDDQVDSISQALAHEIAEAHWSPAHSRNFAKVIEGWAMDEYWRSMGRPW